MKELINTTIGGTSLGSLVVRLHVSNAGGTGLMPG